jgi:hypothetical protein
VPVAAAHPPLQVGDGRGLVAGGDVVADDLEFAVEPRNVERHAANRTPGV